MQEFLTTREVAALLRVKERIESADGQTWSDVAAWYWQASLGHATGPYLCVLVASVERPDAEAP